MKRFLAAAAAAPLCFAAQAALAQTTITTNTVAPLATSTTGDLTVSAGAGVTVRTGGPVITVDSDNAVIINGSVSARDSTSGGTGILVTTGSGVRSSNITVAGAVGADDTVAAVDSDGDGIPDTPFATPGIVRYGVRVTGPGTYHGTLGEPLGGTIAVKGDSGSAAVSVESNVDGSIILNGNVGATGDNTFGLHTTGDLTGHVTISGQVNVQGGGATAIAIDGNLTGQLLIDGVVANSGYRYLHRSDIPKGATVANLDASDLLTGGPAIRLRGNITQGFVLDAPPPVWDYTDVNGDGALDNLDQDEDGVPDSSEQTGQVLNYGSAPALLAGSTSAITFGNVGTGFLNKYGLIIRGVLQSSGVYDGFSATGVQIAGLGGSVNTSGGVSVTGQINVQSFNANSTGLLLASGAVAPVIDVYHGLISAGTSTVEGTVVSARGLVIEAGSTTSVLNNNGTIKAGLNGPAGNAIAVVDNSGLLSTITNTDTIQATVRTSDGTGTATGDSIALDLRANTTGVTLTQNANPTPNSTAVSTIVGDVLLSANNLNDSVTINSGQTTGLISFGGGTDVLAINGGSSVTGGILKGAGALDVNVAHGVLSLTRTATANVSSLEVGGSSTLIFTADPVNADPLLRSAGLNVSGQAVFDAGSQIKMLFDHKLAGNQTFSVVTAGTLVNNGVSADLNERMPAIFTGQMTVGTNNISIVARRRTTDELGLFGGRAQTYEAFYQAFDQDTGVESDILSKTTIGSFTKLYNQFLPDYSGGPFKTLSSTTRESLAAQAESPAGLPTDQPRSWLQEVGLTVKQETVDDVPYQTGGFGVVGGYERPVAGGGFAGVSGSYMSSEIRNKDRFLGSHLSASAATAGVYWRQPKDDLTLDADLTGGFAWFDSVRKIVDQNTAGQQLLVRTANGNWNGALAAGRVGATYNLKLGNIYLRPSADIDAVYLGEGAYKETGGGDSVNLSISSRNNYEAAAQAGIVIGGTFGRSYHWSPELELGFREILASGSGATSGEFVSVPGSTFNISGLARQKGLLIIRAALRGQGAFSAMAFEAGGEVGSNYSAYTARFAIRFVF